MLRRTFLPVLASPLLAAEEPKKAEPIRQAPIPGEIKVQVNEVIVPVTVTDDKDRFVSDLDQKDFTIIEEGKPQRIIYFNRERNQPVVVGFLLDISNSSRLHWKTFQEASLDLVQNLLPGDKKYSGYLISYATDAELQVNTSNDPEKMMEKIRRLKPGGGSALFDAVYMACTSRDLVKGEPIEPRRIIVVIGDGNDSASKKTLDQVLELAQRNLVTIYGVSTVAFGFNNPGEANLRRLCEETGGRVETPLNSLYKDVSGYLSTPSDEGNYALKVGTGGYASEISKGIFNAIAKVAGEITTQYVMRYIPESTDSAKLFRKVEVRVNLPGVKVRHRNGYYPINP
ncbi:MAG: VWA domain-containing protein [Bryobacterales bacterium]|nr:VWA domain-containing protein [Bryobacterales bacterium]